MTIAKKLDTFILKDKFGLSMTEIEQEAMASAHRRSEIMGWTDIFINLASTPVTIENEYRCFPFEIWGFEMEMKNRQDNEPIQKNHPKDIAAAKSVNP